MKIRVGISARHIHLNREILDLLFGSGYELTKKNDLSQPGQFASNETVIIKTEKSQIERVRILGPLRDYNQIELAKTDSFGLGITPPVRKSGDVEGSETVTLVGPKGEVTISGAIIAVRHLHLDSKDMEKYQIFSEQQKIKLVIPGKKGGVLDNVIVRISDDFSTEIHLDVDDANAHLIECGQAYEIIKEVNNE